MCSRIKEPSNYCCWQVTREEGKTVYSCSLRTRYENKKSTGRVKTGICFKTLHSSNKNCTCLLCTVDNSVYNNILSYKLYTRLIFFFCKTDFCFGRTPI